MAKLVSVIVPCFNQAQFLDEALQSVLEQSYSNWECIIVNDGSPDNTEDVADKWVKKDSRFKYIYQNNSGVSMARNFGINVSNGAFVLPLDADDKIAKEYISLAVESFRENPKLTVVYCKAEKFGIENGICDLPLFSLKALSKQNIIFCSGLYRKKDWTRVGGYDCKMDTGLEDWEFWISILKTGGEVKCLPMTGFYYRIKEESRQTKIKSKNYEALFEYLSIKHADFFVNYFGSFFALDAKIIQTKKIEKAKLKSKKYVIDVFCKRFFGFTIFGLYKNEF